MTFVQFIQQFVSAPVSSIQNTVELLKNDHTIPFIARYRKDATGNLDEVVIEQIANYAKEFDAIVKRKEAILKAISGQESLTPELETKINKAFTLIELEDLYLPYKKSKRTKAAIARENGLEPLAKIIMAQQNTDCNAIAQKYISKNVPDTSKALEGAEHIIAEWINENIYIRNHLRRTFQRQATLQTKVVKAEENTENAQKYKAYFDWSENITRMPSHRLLAVLRAENEGYIKIKIKADDEEANQFIKKTIIKTSNATTPIIENAIEDSYKRLLFPAISNEILQECKAKADEKSIAVFASNLNQLLLEPPLGEKRILAIDPGFKSGCKIVCLDEKGDLLYNETIYPHAPQNDTNTALKKIKSMVNAYKIEAISIGNGTASRETESFIKKIGFEKDIQVFLVNENGASVYSASKIARDEFPNYDVTVRGAISIGRRLADPLAELVKIDPKAIGVGQYQHDVNQTKLKESLDQVVMRCVNTVGINLNTASPYLLNYVSGIGEKLAENIIAYRTENGAFTSRNELKKVTGLGKKAFEQGAAFIRIANPKNPLDNSAVHPESYPIVEKMAKDLNTSVKELIGNKELIAKIKTENYITKETGLLGLQDILKELVKPGLDPRKKVQLFEFNTRIKSINDLETGMILSGIINNITNFGCFVDIGIKESGLVHISQLKAGFVSDVNEVVRLNQHVEVKVVEVDESRKRIQLSMVI